MIDFAKVKIKAGNGGNGLVHFRREKFVPRGGPDGGDGGKGGDAYFVVNENLTTIMDFRAKAFFKAFDGGPGGITKRTGAGGEDLFLDVPVGTLVKSITKANPTGDIIADLTKNGEKYLVARGGAAGKGNFRFKSSTNRTPLQYTEGEVGEEKDLILEIKLIADVGLIGLPNAGKSTLLNALTKANARVGSYPFTTIEPNLGVMMVPERKATFVIADLPGLIEGAAQGRGLGDEFLKHVERTRLLVHIIDPYEEDPVKSYKVIRAELSSYSEDLYKKKEIVVVNKIDITEVAEKKAEIKKAFKKIKVMPLFVSGATGEGVNVLKNKIADEIVKLPKVLKSKVMLTKAYTITNLPNRRIVFRGKPKEADAKILGR